MAILTTIEEIDFKKIAEEQAKEAVIKMKLTAFLNSIIEVYGVVGDCKKTVEEIAEHFGLQSTLEKLKSV